MANLIRGPVYTTVWFFNIFSVEISINIIFVLLVSYKLLVYP